MIWILLRESLQSISEKLKSAAAKTFWAFSGVDTVLSEAVGALLGTVRDVTVASSTAALLISSVRMPPECSVLVTVPWVVTEVVQDDKGLLIVTSILMVTGVPTATEPILLTLTVVSPTVLPLVTVP